MTYLQYQPLVSVAKVVDVFEEKKYKIFSTLDMLSGYHQVKITEYSKKFIGFTFLNGEQHLIDSVFHYVTFQHILCANQGLFQHSINIIIGHGGRFGRGVSLYRYRLQLFVRLWARFPLPTAQFSEI